MANDRWRQIAKLYEAALAQAPEERAAFLSANCPDEDVRVEVASLLQQTAATTELPSRQIGSYRIVSLLGAGGMGAVYLADDTRLRRKVALKVLHPATAGEETNRRLLHEARAAAALDHPNICAIYEAGEADGHSFIAMQFVEGDTLASRLARGSLPVADGLAAAIEVAGALVEAHRQGVVHRDIKPQNIVISTRGQAKVLDFGIAKRIAMIGSAAQTGTVVSAGWVAGTAAYMSPEQARGEELDGRSDIFSFGIVLCEMLMGRHPFERSTPADTLVAIIGAEPRIDPIRDSRSPELARIIRTCLERDKTWRYESATHLLADLKRLHRGQVSGPTDDSPPRDLATPVPAARGRRTAAAVAIGLLALGVLVGAAAWYRDPVPQRTGAPAHFLVPLSPSTQLSGLDFPSVALSPDGSRLAFVGRRGGQTLLFVRQMNAPPLDATPLPGTANAMSPFFSPDGTWVAFFADGQLKKVALTGGMPIPLCEAQVGLGGSWGADGRIVFASNTGSGLSTVSSDAGRPVRITSLDTSKGEFSHRWPEWLPGGESVIYAAGTVGTWNQAEIVAQSLRTGERTVLVPGGTNPHFLPTGHLVYAHDGRIFAVPFDPRRLRVTGTPVSVIDNVIQSTDGAAQFAISQAGMAAYVSGESESSQGRLVTVTRNGAVTVFAAQNGQYSSPRVSSDGKKLIVAKESPASDLWVYDLGAGSWSQLTYDAGATSPLWTPDGRAVFSATKNGPPNLFISDVARQGPLEPLLAGENFQIPGSWTSEGLLAFVERRAGTGRDLLLLPRGSRVAQPLLASPSDESAPRFSPNGRWLAYVSNQSGQNEVYLRAASGDERSQPVSVNGGMEPVWASTGNELFYREGNKMMSVALPGRTTRLTQPEKLFEGEFARGTIDSPNFDVMPDGRFLMVQRPQETGQATLHVLVNWFATFSAP